MKEVCKSNKEVYFFKREVVKRGLLSNIYVVYLDNYLFFSIRLKPKRFQSTSETNELPLPFQYFQMGTINSESKLLLIFYKGTFF